MQTERRKYKRCAECSRQVRVTGDDSRCDDCQTRFYSEYWHRAGMELTVEHMASDHKERFWVTYGR